jgi:hypothetical protein
MYWGRDRIAVWTCVADRREQHDQREPALAAVASVARHGGATGGKRDSSRAANRRRRARARSRRGPAARLGRASRASRSAPASARPRPKRAHERPADPRPTCSRCRHRGRATRTRARAAPTNVAVHATIDARSSAAEPSAASQGIAQHRGRRHERERGDQRADALGEARDPVGVGAGRPVARREDRLVELSARRSRGRGSTPAARSMPGR